jgi:hypothetical protein
MTGHKDRVDVTILESVTKVLRGWKTKGKLFKAITEKMCAALM